MDMSFKCGSSLICSNPSDIDYLCIIPNDARRFDYKNGNNEYHYITNQEFKNQLNFSSIYSLYTILYELNRKEFKDLLEGWSWWDHQKDAVKCALKYGEMNFFHPRVKSLQGGCPKHMYYALFTIYAIENQSFKMTKEQQEMIDKAHDGVLPLEYRDIIREKLEHLLETLPD